MVYPNDNADRYSPTHAAGDCDVHMDVETLGTYAYDILGNRLGVIERCGGTATNPEHYCKHETHRLIYCRLTNDLQTWCVRPPDPTIDPRRTRMNI